MSSEAAPVAAHGLNEAIGLYRRGRLNEAESLCADVLRADAHDVRALHLLAFIFLKTKRLPAAAELLGEATRLAPRDASGHVLHASVLCQLEKYSEAIASCGSAIALDPDNPRPYFLRGNALRGSAQYGPAIGDYDRSIALAPGDPDPHINRGVALHALQRFADAVASYDRAIALRPESPVAHHNRGTALAALQEYEAAVLSFDAAIAIAPKHATAHGDRANALRALGRYEAALAGVELAIACAADKAEFYNLKGSLLSEMRQFPAAITAFQQAIALAPGFVAAHFNLGAVHLDLEQYQAAESCLSTVISLDPSHARAHRNRADALCEMGAFPEALAAYQEAIALDPDVKGLLGNRQHTRMQLCDWRDIDVALAEIAAGISRGATPASPFVVQTLFGSPALQKKAAETWVREECQPSPAPWPTARPHRSEKIRVAYFSGDFRMHPVSVSMAEVFEGHDRTRYDVTAVSFGPDIRDELRQRLEGAFDRFIDVRDRSDREIVGLARELDIDIAVDLGGFTSYSRPNVFAGRAAPVQVSYLGYLGTMGAPFMDYLIADRTIVPERERRHYSEKILYLPSYQANASKRRIADRDFTREELGLPASGFVYCCFNNSYKIMPATFDVWMRILNKVPDSVLFLYSGHAEAERNLRREAQERGVDGARLVFGGRLEMPEYLARYRTADLFLDTLPYNAGTTASDALWAGLPVLTCLGESFSGRVAASVLNAVGMPELVTSTAAQYEQAATDLAADRQRILQIRRKLADNHSSALLFASAQLTRHLESAFAAIHARRHANLPPAHLEVTQASSVWLEPV
jgi:predicted O-linked N-acetylglucosamine transferase (SPINDLY family)